MLLLSLSDSSRFGLEEAVPGRRRLLRSEGSRDVTLVYLDIKYNSHSSFLGFLSVSLMMPPPRLPNKTTQPCRLTSVSYPWITSSPHHFHCWSKKIQALTDFQAVTVVAHQWQLNWAKRLLLMSVVSGNAACVVLFRDFPLCPCLLELWFHSGQSLKFCI